MSPSVVVLGNFDGVHRGHQAVLEQARTLADSRGLRCVVFTFDPHPREVLGAIAGPGRSTHPAPPRLTAVGRRVELLRSHGATDVVVEPFTLELAAWSPARFASELLAARLGAKAVVVGRDFRFGHKRAGDVPMLESLGKELGFEVVSAAIFGDERGPFSSTRAREAIARGDVEGAAHVLGRPHELTGVVEHGAARGRTIGFPTANLGGVVEMLPAYGVYAVRAYLLHGADAGAGADGAAANGATANGAGADGAAANSAAANSAAADGAAADGVDHARAFGAWPKSGVMNVGVRPTVGGSGVHVEAHLFDFAGDIYGKALRLELVSQLRGEKKFAGLDELRAQIAEDAAEARRILGD